MGWENCEFKLKGLQPHRTSGGIAPIWYSSYATNADHALRPVRALLQLFADIFGNTDRREPGNLRKVTIQDDVDEDALVSWNTAPKGNLLDLTGFSLG